MERVCSFVGRGDPACLRVPIVGNPDKRMEVEGYCISETVKITLLSIKPYDKIPS